MHCVNELCYILIISIFNFLHKFYKQKSTAKVKTYFQIYPHKETDKYSTLDPHGAYRMKKAWKNFRQVLYYCFKS